MSFIDIPNLPRKPVDSLIIDGRIPEEIESCLKGLGIKAIKTSAHEAVYEAISCHPDIMLHHLGGYRFIYAPETPEHLLDSISRMGFVLIKGRTSLTDRYPGTIAYNVARVGKFAFHNLKFTDPVLRDELIKLGVELVHVNQGYTKCNVSVVDEKSIITSDFGIAEAAKSKGIDVLLIPPKENIRLNGFDEGFIGGSTALLDRDKWAVAGNIHSLNSSEMILSFLGKRGISAISLYDGPVMDIGSMLPIKTRE